MVDPAVACIGISLVVPDPVARFELGACCKVTEGIDACQRIKQASDRVLNHGVIGSCTLGNYPEQTVFIDTRFDFYGPEFYRATAKTLGLTGDWRGFLDAWKANTIVIQKIRPLSRLLEQWPRYELLLEDDAVRIFRA